MVLNLRHNNLLMRPVDEAVFTVGTSFARVVTDIFPEAVRATVIVEVSELICSDQGAFGNLR